MLLRSCATFASVALGRTVVSEPGDSDDEIVCFDDVDPDDETPDEDTPEQAIDLLRRALSSELRAQPPQSALTDAAAQLRQGLGTDAKPFRYMRRAQTLAAELPAEDVDLVVCAAAAFITPRGIGLAPEDVDRIASLEKADWFGAVVGLVRGGAGTSASPARLVQAINECPEVDGQVSPVDADPVEAAFELVLPAWEAAGVVDADWRVTTLGCWVLPRALAAAWGGNVDGPSPLP